MSLMFEMRSSKQEQETACFGEYKGIQSQQQLKHIELHKDSIAACTKIV
jgi:hypothetical protein